MSFQKPTVTSEINYTARNGEEMSKYRFDFVIFDFDGTVVKTDDAIVYCALEAMRMQIGDNVLFDESTVRTLIASGATLAQTFASLRVPESDIPAYISSYREIYRTAGDSLCSLFDRVTETFQELSQAGISLALLSNKGQAAVERAVERFGLKPWLRLYMGEQAGMEPKPNPQIFDARVAPQLGISDRSRVLVVGDTAADILFAKNIGCSSCWVTYGFGNPVECAALNPDHTANSVPAVAELILGRRRLINLSP